MISEYAEVFLSGNESSELMEVSFFYFLASLTVISALGVVFSPKPTRALLCLIVTMSLLSCLYLMLNAPFVAMINLIVYAGAILILFLFVIMLQGIGAKEIPVFQRFRHGFLLLALILPVVLGAGIIALSFPHSAIVQSSSSGLGNAKAIGQLLFSQYLLPFELISLLLLLAIFAAVSLAKQEDGE